MRVGDDGRVVEADEKAGVTGLIVGDSLPAVWHPANKTKVKTKITRIFMLPHPNKEPSTKKDHEYSNITIRACEIRVFVQVLSFSFVDGS